MSEKVTATFIVIYPIIHEVLHILMYMLLANCIFFMKYAFLFSVHFPAELLPFPWFVDTPYTMAIFLLFILYKDFIPGCHFCFCLQYHSQKEVSYAYIFKSVRLSVFGFCSSVLLNVFSTKNSKNSSVFSSSTTVFPILCQMYS